MPRSFPKGQSVEVVNRGKHFSQYDKLTSEQDFGARNSIFFAKIQHLLIL